MGNHQLATRALHQLRWFWVTACVLLGVFWPSSAIAAVSFGALAPMCSSYGTSVGAPAPSLPFVGADFRGGQAGTHAGVATGDDGCAAPGARKAPPPAERGPESTAKDPASSVTAWLAAPTLVPAAPSEPMLDGGVRSQPAPSAPALDGLERPPR